MKTYPYKAWILQPSFKPVEVEFVSEYRYANNKWGVLASGKHVNESSIYTSTHDAICSGRALLQKQQDDLNKKLANIDKRHRALDKAEGKS